MVLVAPPVGKRVFLLIVTTITTVMRGMTPAAATVKKAAVGRSKSPPLAVKKHLLAFPYFISIPIKNTVISFLYRRSRTFFTANGGLFVFAPFQPAIRQARRGVAENIREFALEILSDTHGRIGQSPEKVQIFLFLLLMVYPRNKEEPLVFNAYGSRKISRPTANATTPNNI